MEIRTYPDPVLREKAGQVECVDDDIRWIIDEMAAAMYRDDGVGLAAPQVGISRQIIVVDGGEGFMCLINPEIVESGEETDQMEEGCLSFPGIRVMITRPTSVRVRGMNEKGDSIDLRAEGLPARILQHEIDHLNGILIIDHISSLNRRLLSSKLKKMEKAAG